MGAAEGLSVPDQVCQLKFSSCMHTTEDFQDCSFILTVSFHSGRNVSFLQLRWHSSASGQCRNGSLR